MTTAAEVINEKETEMTGNTDRETMRRINTNTAIDQFREVERARWLLERKEAALEATLTWTIDRDRYFEVTEEIRRQFEAKRMTNAERIEQLGKRG